MSGSTNRVAHVVKRVEYAGEIEVFAWEILGPGDAKSHIFDASSFCLLPRLVN
jgi:hypothetical protein